MEGDAGHAAFVAFARAVNVEVAEAADLRVRFRQDLAHVLIEQEFGVAVHVERRFILPLFDELFAAAVSGGGGGVQERNFAIQTVVQQVFGVLIVIVHHVLAVPLGGRGAGAFVEDRFDIAQIVAGHDAGDKVFFIDIVSDVQIDQVDELGAVFQVIHHQDIAISLVVQCFNDVAADRRRRL